MTTYKNERNIKAWAEDDRPREKMLHKGRGALSDAELVAILLGSGSRNESAVDLGKRLLASVHNNLHELGRLNVAQLCDFRGIGQAKAVVLMAALELGRRRGRGVPTERPRILSSRDSLNVLRPHMEDWDHEQFWMLMLDTKNRLLATEMISQGGMNATIADPRLIFRKALEKKATAIILAHNHPSGNLQPSREDKRLTHRLLHAGLLLDILVHDHLILGHQEYFSFADEGYMDHYRRHSSFPGHDPD
jgi:DNA repair protein RadC